jgi:hypothetical protein
MARTPENEYTRSNAMYWFEHELRQYPALDLGLDALENHTDVIILTAGLESRDYPSYRAAMELGKVLGLDVLELPGGHVGPLSHPAEFARELLQAGPTTAPADAVMMGIRPTQGGMMAAPFIVVRTYTVRAGKLEELKAFLREFFEVIEAKEPRVLAMNAYANADGTEVTFVHIHPDAASMEVHENVAHEHTERARKQFLDATSSLQVYGQPSDTILEGAREMAGTGIPLSVAPEPLGGFTRLGGGQP